MMPLPTHISESVRRLNPQLFGYATGDGPKVPAGLVPGGTGDKKRIRQHQGDGLNKTERAFLSYLKVQYPNDTHRPHALSFRLCNGANYRPDIISTIVVQRATDGSEAVVQMTAWETKGFFREAAAVRIKLAASLYPEITFRLATKRKGREGGWAIETVLP